MTYAASLAAITRTPITYLVMTLDYCAETYGAGSCTASAATKCYNTYPTCRDKANFNKTTKDYTFSTADAPLPFSAGERPYIKSVQYMPTEIKDSLTVTASVKIELYDEPDTDVGIDPYLSDRSSVQGTFWKKLLARNTNYLGRIVKIYEGFSGLAVGDYSQKFVGRITDMELQDGILTMEVSDILTSLSEYTIPPYLNVYLGTATLSNSSQITLRGSGLSSLDSTTGYVRIDDEIIKYEAIDTTTGIISTLTRGSFSTTAANHNESVAVQKVRYFAPASGFDHLKTILLTDCGVAAGYVNDTQFDTERDDAAAAPEVDLSAIISEPANAQDLYFELVELLNCKSWVGEDLKVTIKRNLPNYPGRTYSTLTDDTEIVSGSVDLNQASRVSRCSIYWDRSAVGAVDDPASYARLDVAIDSNAEGVNEYNARAEKTIYCRWLRSGYDTEENMNLFVKGQASRIVSQSRDPMPIVTIKTELKSGDGIKTGDYVKLTTDELQDKDGNDLTTAPFQVIKREAEGSIVTMDCLRISPKRYKIISPSSYSTKDYETATAAEREYGAICDTNGLMAGGDDGYRIW